MITKKQKAARIRNWKLLQLKSAMLFLKEYFPDSTLLHLYSCKIKRKIDKQWEIDKL